MRQLVAECCFWCQFFIHERQIACHMPEMQCENSYQNMLGPAADASRSAPTAVYVRTGLLLATIPGPLLSLPLYAGGDMVSVRCAGRSESCWSASSVAK